MAVQFSALLDSLTQALHSATESSEKIEAPVPVEDGISLLDVKNELFLSYLQNLAFLIILKLRNHKSGNPAEDNEFDNSVVKKLVELQVYLEKGVRPLEARLKYQIDKVLRAADDAKRAQNAAAPQLKPKSHSRHHEESDSDAESAGSDEESEAGVMLTASEITDLQYRPNPNAFVRPQETEEVSYKRESGDGFYKPPRIQATAMPITSGPREKEARKAQKSATLEEFVNTELSSAPFAEPSIGTTTVSGGRRSKSEKERQSEAERREYEEKNYVRLPKETKKERKKKGGREQGAGYGGEEWRGLGEGIDRIERLTKRKDGVNYALDKSRKRKAEDGPKNGGGFQMSEGFQKKLKTENVRRDRGRRKT